MRVVGPDGHIPQVQARPAEQQLAAQEQSQQSSRVKAAQQEQQQPETQLRPATAVPAASSSSDMAATSQPAAPLGGADAVAAAGPAGSGGIRAGTIVGGVVGLALGLAVLAGMAYQLRRRRAGFAALPTADQGQGTGATARLVPPVSSGARPMDTDALKGVDLA